jgi:NhaP-type Na+/H+ and K+/H+ antiporter
MSAFTLKNAARALALVGSLTGLAAVVAADVAQAQDEVVTTRLDDSQVLTKRTKVKPMRVAKVDPTDEALVDELGLELPVKVMKPVKRGKKRRIDFGRFEGY